MAITESLPATRTSTAPNVRWPARLWGVVAVLSIALLLDGFDVSAVGVALPSIGTDLHMSTTSLQWVVNGYVLGFGGFLLLGGRTADLLGRRKIFLIALSVFMLASLAGGLVGDGGLLIATRFIKGVAAAFTAPTALSIATTTFKEGRDRNRALAILTLFGAGGFAGGLIMGGLLTSLGWRWNFLVPVPVALTALVIGYLLIAKDGPSVRGGYDLGGAVTLVAGTLLIVYAVVTAPARGWVAPLTVVLYVLSAALFAAFVAVESRVRSPLIRLGILRSGALVRANLNIVALFASWIPFQFIMTLYLQNDLHWGPLRVALALLPVGLIEVLVIPVTGRLITRFGTAPLIVASMLSLSLGLVWTIIAAGTHPHYAPVVLPTMILFGFGWAFGFPAIVTQATNGVRPDEQGLASGMVQSSSQVGTAISLAVVTALVAGTGVDFAQYRPGVYLVAGIALAGLLVSFVSVAKSRSHRHSVD
ncbi:MFS transporter [Actinoplanes sp. TBRC 11911]|uniref:MFS transporter n=1 Tax=Actinoplanes sp. TBRC 11911 TaxID=2729386 RepID=UPI00145E6605|nr:MFS transporter [Actinoplanes sp. TBRC 11911]NMO49951.1 MFS transporter [Actinoplanes sp. TBRC 11911]